MRPTEAAKLVGLLAAAFPVPAWDDESQDLFRRMIEDLDYAQTQAATLRWIRSSRERPTIADIRGAVAAEMQRTAAIPGELDPDEAWGFVVKCFTTVGRYRTFPHTHQRVAETVERMGWETLCASDNQEADRAHFLQLYKTAAARAKQERLSAPALALPGDAKQLEQQRADGAIEAPRKSLPAPSAEDRASGVSSIRGLIDSIARHASPVELTEPSVAAPTLREPTQQEIEAAKRQREKMREQLRSIDGGKGRAA